MIEFTSKKEGAELTSIICDGEEKLHNGIEFWNRHAPILFPIVGKLKDNKTIINGKTYEMGQHGFARDMEFEEIYASETKVKYVLKSNEKTLAKFPFKFNLYVSYEVCDNSLITKYEVENKDDKVMIFGLGGHPAFKCDYSSGEYLLEFEKEEDKIEIYQLKDGLIDNIKNDRNKILNKNIIELRDNSFDNDAIIMKNIKSNKIKLINKNANKKLLEFDFTGFPYLAIWSKRGAPFVCIEPWFNTADKVDSNGIFEEKEDLIELNPNEKFECKYKVSF